MKENRSFHLASFFLYVFAISLLLCFSAGAMDTDMGYKEQIFTSDDGLPTTSTLTMVQCNSGFVWLGSYGGLARYDGREFVVFENGVLTNVSTLYGEDDGTLWIGSTDCGLVRLRDGEFFYYGDNEENTFLPVIRRILRTPDGTFYFAHSKGIGYLDPENEDRLCTLDNEILNGKNILSIVCGNGGELWCLDDSGAVYSLAKNGTETEVVQMPIAVENAQIRCMEHDPYSNRVYLGTDSDLVMICGMDGQVLEEVHLGSISSINSFDFSPEGFALIGSDNGAAFLKDGVVTVQKLKVENSIEDVMIDLDGNYWFASSRQGVLLVTPGRFRDISLLAELPKYVVNTLLVEDGRMYVGHDGGFLILDEKTFEVIKDENYAVLDGLRIRHMYLDSQGRLWVCTTGKGLLMREADGETWKQYCQEKYPELGSDKIRCVLETGQGMLAGTDAGVYVIGEDSVTKLAEDLNVRALCLMEKDGDIYAGTDGDGVYVIRDGEVQRRITTAEGLSANTVMKIHSSTDGKGLWMATGKNVEYVDLTTGEVIRRENFPPANVLDCIVMEDGTLWVLAGNGIFQTSEEELLSTGEITNYRHYSGKNGIPSDVTANSFPVLTDECAYLCGAEGIIWMYLDPKYGLPESYKIVLDSMVQDGEESYIQGMESVEIGADIQRLEFQPHISTFTQENPTLFYYLEGFEDDRQYIDYEKLSPIVYTNIPGGEYTFHFGVYDAGDPENSQEIQIRMNVAYQWYEHKSVIILFNALVVLLLILILSLLIRNWVRKERRTLLNQYKDNEQLILRRMAFHDYLTGLYNRNYLSHWQQEEYRNYTAPISVIVLDCNNLKLINDRFGHAKGDALLKNMADILKQTFSGDRDRVFRVGGDEFLIITEADGIEAESKIRNASNLASQTRICEIPISFCHGIASCEDRKLFNLDRMIRESDEQMIRNKQAFHNRGKGSREIIREICLDDSRKEWIRQSEDHDILSHVLYDAFSGASEYVYMYVLDMYTGLSRWSDNCVEYFGLPGQFIKNADRVWLEHVHPDDREGYEEDLMAVLTGQSNKHDYQYRARNRFGNYVWIECKGIVVSDSEGKNIFAGMMTRLDNQSIYDPLTGLKTKNQFYDYDFRQEKGIVLLLGIDNFRTLIEIYGYENSDEVLIQVGRSLLNLHGDTGRVYRFSEEEFVLLFPNGTPMDVENLLRTLRQEVGNVTLENGLVIDLSFSGGAVYYPLDNGTTDVLVNRLESTLAFARKEQKGSVIFYSDLVEEKESRLRELKKELKYSIANGFEGFELYYQPWIQRENNQIVGCEALLRWKGSTIVDSTPAEFIPILEESDEIVEVGGFVMREAMRQQKLWSEKYGNFLMSFNVSYRQFLVKNFSETIIKTARQLGVKPSNIVIELTESCKVQTPNTLADIFKRLRKAGFRIVLDDFGTGYASLELLKKLPADGIKIEHSFVKGLSLETNGIDFQIIKAILYLCDEVDQRVIVEGVENEMIDSIVRNMNVEYLQGYYYSEPVCVGEFERIVQKYQNAAGEGSTPPRFEQLFKNGLRGDNNG